MTDPATATGPVPGFEASTFSPAGREREVYRAGSGPAVIVIHEMPGLHPGVAAFGQRLVGSGYRVYLPSLFGRPGLPIPLTARHRAAVGLDAADLAAVSERARQGLCVLGLRFSNDMGSPPERFQTLRRELGAGFEAIEIDSSPGNPHGIGTRAHSVLTVELVDEPGHPTKAALDRVMAFLDERLRPQPHP